jgi:hypothetical protein
MRPPPRYTPPGYPEFGHTSCNSPAECASEVFLDVDGALIDAVDIDAELGKRRARQCDDVPAGAVTVEFSWVGGLERREDPRRPTRQRPLYTNPIEVHFGPLRQLTLANSRAKRASAGADAPQAVRYRRHPLRQARIRLPRHRHRRRTPHPAPLVIEETRH